MLCKEQELCLQQQVCVQPTSDAASELQQKYSSIIDFVAAQTQEIFVSSMLFP